MSKIQIPKKLRTEDFDDDYSELIDKVGYAYNNFADEVYQQLSGRLDFTNLDQQLVVLDVTITSAGQIINTPQIKVTKASKVNGIQVIRAQNLLNPNIYPTGTPFISFSLNGNLLTIQNITGLQASSQYRLTFVLI